MVTQSALAERKEILVQICRLLFESEPGCVSDAVSRHIGSPDRYTTAQLQAGLGIPAPGARGQSLSASAEQAMNREQPGRPGITVLQELCGSCESRPCLERCPTGSLRETAGGEVSFDSGTCILCGKCHIACRKNAVLDASQIADTVRALKSGRHMTMLLSPAVNSQYPGGPQGIRKAALELGFQAVRELSETALRTISEEVRELELRERNGREFIASSCCPAWLMAVEKLLPQFSPYTSAAHSPMHHAAQAARDRVPGTVTVFIGPCFAKKAEAFHDPLVDIVLTFEELQALFTARGIPVEDMGGRTVRGGKSTPAGREETQCPGNRLPVSGGMAAAVVSAAGKKCGSAAVINGLTKQSLEYLSRITPGEAPGEFLEVMACEGGCVAGPGVLSRPVSGAGEFLYRVETKATPDIVV